MCFPHRTIRNTRVNVAHLTRGISELLTRDVPDTDLNRLDVPFISGRFNCSLRHLGDDVTFNECCLNDLHDFFLNKAMRRFVASVRGSPC